MFVYKARAFINFEGGKNSYSTPFKRVATIVLCALMLMAVLGRVWSRDGFRFEKLMEYVLRMPSKPLERIIYSLPEKAIRFDKRTNILEIVAETRYSLVFGLQKSVRILPAKCS